MVDIADSNNPLLNAMEELNKGIESLGNTQQTMLQYTVSKDISNKQEKSKEDVMAAAARDVDLVQQGQEVQLTRDAQLINDRNNKQLQNLSPGGQALATNEEASQTRTLLTVLTFSFSLLFLINFKRLSNKIVVPCLFFAEIYLMSKSLANDNLRFKSFLIIVFSYLSKVSDLLIPITVGFPEEIDKEIRCKS